MTEEVKKEAEETAEVKVTGETQAEETKATKEATQEAAQEAAQEAGKPTSEAAQQGITESEETKEADKSTEGFSKDSNDSSEEQPPSGITDDEISRVFDAIPRKSKVALNRVESKMDNVKSAKSSPTWYPWLFSIIMIIGLLWAVVYYLTGAYPIPHIGAWNLCISFVTILVGFAMTMAWK